MPIKITPLIQRQPEEEGEVQTKPLDDNISPFIQGQAEEEEELQRQVEENEEVQKHSEEEGVIQTKGAAEDTEKVKPFLENRINRLKGGGRPLPGSERSYFEPRFGYDFSSVRLHTDSNAAETAHAVNARAFTLGNNIVFGRGYHSFESSEGKMLMAHELTHVVQQGGGDAPLAPVHSGISRIPNGINRLIQRERIFWEDRNRLQWTDFKGAIDHRFPHEAVTKTGWEVPSLKLYAEHGVVRPPIACTLKKRKMLRYHARVSFDPNPTKNNVRAYMETNQSWVKPGKANSRLLRHEQGHFDITNVMSEKFQAKILTWGKSNASVKDGCGKKAAIDAAVAAFEAKNFVKEIQAIGEIAIRVKDEAQADYDRETRDGSNARNQENWETRIRNGLPKYEIKEKKPSSECRGTCEPWMRTDLSPWEERLIGGPKPLL